MPRCFLDTVPPMRERNLIQVRFEDLLLVVMLLHLSSRCLLAQFASEAHVAPIDDVRMHVADELLRDRACTTPLFAEYPAFDRAADANQVDAIVLVESLIFDGDKCLRHIAWQRTNGNA